MNAFIPLCYANARLVGTETVHDVPCRVLSQEDEGFEGEPCVWYFAVPLHLTAGVCGFEKSIPAGGDPFASPWQPANWMDPAHVE